MRINASAEKIHILTQRIQIGPAQESMKTDRVAYVNAQKGVEAMWILSDTTKVCSDGFSKLISE